jgi:tRNA(Ile)-lysidine synthase
MSRLPASLSLPVAVVADAHLWVALSGGLDSTALLHALAARWQGQRAIRAVHVHHGLQPDADDWAAHCTALCAARNVPLDIVRVAVDRRSGEGLEAAARRARHAAFAQVMQPGDVLIAAHHQDDQAETFLLRALRASGPEGLAAMRPWRRFAQGWLWRPWLALPRSAIADYAQAQQLTWIEDGSNADTALDRNFLRHQILPLLQARWPQAAAALARSATLSGQADALLATQDEQALLQVRSDDPQALSAEGLSALEPALRARVVRRWIVQCDLPPFPARGIAQLESDLLTARGDGHAQFDWDGACLRVWRGRLHAQRSTPALPSDWSAPWDGRQALALPDGGRLALLGASHFAAPVQVTARRGGERIRLPGRAHSHALKHVLQDAALPPWERAQLPLLRDADGSVLAAGDRIHADRFAAWLHAHGATLHWTRPGRD